MVAVARRPFLPDVEAPWIETRRAALRALLGAASSAWRRLVKQATRWRSRCVRSEILDLEPFRETAYQALMRLHSAMGNRAEALRVFERCRTLLREELGASPSHQTEALFLEILRSGG